MPKQRRQKTKKETKTRNQKKAKKKDKEERKKITRERERDREREIEKGGGQKRLRRNKGRHSKINKKCPFLGWKTVVLLQAKNRKKTKRAFRLSINFFFLGGCPKFPFLTTWPKKRAPKKHYQQGIFWKRDMRHETATFGQKTNPEIPVIIFFGLFLLFQQQNIKISWNRIIIVF